MQIQTILKKINDGIIPNNFDTTFGFLDEYRQHYSYYDRYIIKNFGTLMLIDSLIGDSDSVTIQNVQDAILDDLLANQISIEKIYSALISEYEIINNYDKTSTITYLNDKVTTETLVGTRKTVDNLGQINTTDTTPQHEDVTTHNVTGFDATMQVAESSDINKMGDMTSTHSEQAVTNQSTQDAATDKNIIGGTAENGKIENVTSERTFGNIGVTTSQQMIESELDLRKKYNFYDYLFGIVVDAITVPLFEEV